MHLGVASGAGELEQASKSAAAVSKCFILFGPFSDKISNGTRRDTMLP